MKLDEEDMDDPDLSETERTALQRPVARQGSSSSKINYGRPTGSADAETCEASAEEPEIGDAVERHAILETTGGNLTPPQEALNSPNKLKYEAAAAEPPYTPYPAPYLTTQT